MVAKTYQNLPTVGDVYTQNGRKYIQVRTTNGTLKKVRWYSEKEYAKMYPESAAKALAATMKPLKDVLGFEKGYITIFTGNTYEDKEYFKNNAARYHRIWGWYFVSTDELPTDIPSDVFPVRLPWELVGKEDGNLRPESEIVAALETLLYEEDNSEYQGEIGDRLDVIVSVERAIKLDGAYGPSTMHIMRDYDGNCYIWTTATRSWEEGSEHHIIGTVKDHRTYKRVKQTILTRCRSLD
jgi:hypothetical protein